MNSIASDVAGRIWLSPELKADFEALCRFDGRVVGTEGEARARAFLKQRIEEIAGRPPAIHAVAHDGWRRRAASLDRTYPDHAVLPCDSLIWSPPTPPGGIEAEVLDIGRGTPEGFDLHADEIPGRIVLARHEFMFASGHIARRQKIAWAHDRGALAFLAANYRPGHGIVTGSGWHEAEGGIPGAGTSYEAAAALAPRNGEPCRARLVIEVERKPMTAENLIVEFPGETDEWVVLSAHYDGHHLGDSAIDNGSGTATALAIARALAPHAGRLRRGLRLCLFTVEEWGLKGSRVYVDGMSAAQRDSIAFNVNLDAVAGTGRLTALSSENSKVERFVRGVADELGIDLGYYRPMMPNSDHFNFARHGIPAMRFAAGFEQNSHDTNMKYVLTPGDTRDKVSALELKQVALVASAVVLKALTARTLELRP